MRHDVGSRVFTGAPFSMMKTGNHLMSIVGVSCMNKGDGAWTELVEDSG